jgi:hypothetical protein
MLVACGKPTDANAEFTVCVKEGAANFNAMAELTEAAVAALGHCVLNATTTPVWNEYCPEAAAVTAVMLIVEELMPSNCAMVVISTCCAARLSVPTAYPPMVKAAVTLYALASGIGGGNGGDANGTVALEATAERL